MVNSHCQHKPISSEILKVHTLAFTQKLQSLVHSSAQRKNPVRLAEEGNSHQDYQRVDEAVLQPPSHLPPPFVHVT